MNKLIFPQANLKITERSGRTFVFDILRKRHVALTPEEWVRQHVVHYLIFEKNYPKALMKSEDGLLVNDMKRRSDVVVYDRTGAVYMLVECKAPVVRINQHTVDQAAAYNLHYRSQYLTVTNGLVCAIFSIDYHQKTTTAIATFPEFDGTKQE
jgi:hypothetical protein